MLTFDIGKGKNKVVGIKAKKKETKSIPVFSGVKKKRFSKKIEDTVMFEGAIFNMFKEVVPKEQLHETLNVAQPLSKNAKRYLT